MFFVAVPNCFPFCYRSVLGSGSRKGSRPTSKEGKRAESKSPARSPTKADSPSKKSSRGKLELMRTVLVHVIVSNCDVGRGYLITMMFQSLDRPHPGELALALTQRNVHWVHISGAMLTPSQMLLCLWTVSYLAGFASKLTQ